MAKILIVEDDEAVRTLAARALERMGHSIDLACDGAEGLDRVCAVQGGYDLVVSDIRMPAMDGIAMAKEIALRFPALRIMLVTGYADQRERAAELDGTVVDVVQKPFTLSIIRERVDAVLSMTARAA